MEGASVRIRGLSSLVKTPRDNRLSESCTSGLLSLVKMLFAELIVRLLLVLALSHSPVSGTLRGEVGESKKKERFLFAGFRCKNLADCTEAVKIESGKSGSAKDESVGFSRPSGSHFVPPPLVHRSMLCVVCCVLCVVCCVLCLCVVCCVLCVVCCVLCVVCCVCCVACCVLCVVCCVLCVVCCVLCVVCCVCVC